MYYSIFEFLTMKYSFLQHITGHNIVLQSNIVRLCTLQCAIVVYSMCHYIIMFYIL